MLARKPRGIVLISVMFLAVLIAMYVTSSALLTRGQYGALRQSAEDRRAEEAARSGLEYAQARLEEDPEWRGDGGVVVDTPTLMVREHAGNVVGVVTTSDGGRGQFRIRFNHQDGSGGPDEMVDPPADMLIDSPHVSVNNVLNYNRVGLPLGDGPNFACVGTVTDYSVPEFSAAIVCEGRVFEQLAAATADKVNLPPQNKVQAVRVIEAFYRVSDFDGEAPVQDAVTMAGRGVNIKLFPGEGEQRVALSNFQGTGQALLRSKGGVSVTDTGKNEALLDGQNAQVLLPNGDPLKALLGSGVQRGPEDVNGDFYKLLWEDVSKIGADAGTLKAGVYVYWASDQKLHYYDQSFADYRKAIKANPNNPGVVVDLPPDNGVSFVRAGERGPDGQISSKNRFVVTRDVAIEAGNTKELTIIPRAGAKEDLAPESSSGTGSGSGGLGSGGGDGDSANNDLPQLPYDFVAMLGLPESPPLPALPGMVEAAISQASWGNHQVLHNTLGMIAKEGTIQYNGDQGIAWDHDGINQQGGQKALATTDFFFSRATLTNVQNPNMSFLEDLGGGEYRVKEGLVEALLTGQPWSPGSTSSSELSEIDLGAAAASEPLTARDFELTFAPAEESSVRLVAPGDVRIAAGVKGSGASLISGGEVRLVGVGFDVDAGDQEGTNVSLYAKDKIVVSTLKKNESQDYEFTGFRLHGVLYSWKDIELKMGHKDDINPDPQNVYIQGAMVAYGGEPGVDSPGRRGGKIEIRADQVDLVFDPAYLMGLGGLGGYRVSLAPLSQSNR
jgi:hypothetical protein